MMFEQLTEESSNLGSNNDVDLEKLLKLGDWKGLFLGLFDTNNR